MFTSSIAIGESRARDKGERGAEGEGTRGTNRPRRLEHRPTGLFGRVAATTPTLRLWAAY